MLALFLQKFTAAEAEQYAQTGKTARDEIAAKHAPTLAAELARIASALETAKAAKEKTRQKELAKEKTDLEKRHQEQVDRESRQLLKERFDYPVFLYEAEKVGLTATGEADANELYPNDRLPAGVEKTALEQYFSFRDDPTPFFV